RIAGRTFGSSVEKRGEVAVVNPTGGALYRNPRRSPRHSLGHGAGRRTVRSGTAAAEARNRVYEPVSSVGHEGCPRPAQSGPHRRSGSRAAAAAVTPDDRIA